MNLKHKLLTILMLALVSTLLIFTACEKDEDDDPATDDPTNSAPVANFEADQTNIAAGESVTFTDQSTNEPISWSWDFGDGNTSNEVSPSHTYDIVGSYTVELTVTNDHGSDTETKTDYIRVANWGNGVTDIDGNNYASVIIGNQEWMAENLKTTTYNNGTSVDLVTDDAAWRTNSTGAYCWYDNDEAQYAETYGSLYNWYAVETGNLCPAGWHVPTDEDWKTLEMELGMSQSEADADDIFARGTNEGSKLAGNGALWFNGDLKNDSKFGSSGFTGIPGGGRDGSGEFGYVDAGIWWSATASTYTAWFRMLGYDSSGVYRNDYLNKAFGVSVRCVRD